MLTEDQAIGVARLAVKQRSPGWQSFEVLLRMADELGCIKRLVVELDRQLIHWMSPCGYGDTCEFLKELQVRRASDVSQSDIDTLAEIRDLLDSMVEDAGAEGRNSDFSEYLGMREVMSRIITALRSR